MPPIRSASVLVPTWQGMEFLERVFAALARQEPGFAWDVHVVDSGSTDGTREFLEELAGRFPVPLAVGGIEQLQFDHGDTRNLLAARSAGDLLVFLTQDAIPSSPRWLATLARNFEDERVGAAYCRNVPRPDADPLTAIFSAGDPGYAAERREVRLPPPADYAALDPHARRLLYNFNDVASAVRRPLWERHPFPRTAFGEDVLMARALLEAGWTVVYDAEATVEHSHDYDEAETYRRAFIDGRFSVEWLDRVCVASRADAETLTDRLHRADAGAIRALGRSLREEGALLVRARKLRAAAFRGLHDGGRSERRHAPTRLLDSPRLRVLYVVHGFPPDTWAGTEVYTYNLALEMQRRGHEVAVLARAPADERGLPDFHLEERGFEGLRVLRVTNRLEHASLRGSYHDARAEALFRRVLLAERPDVVHFQHLIHSSAGLVAIARDAGIGTLLHCHDYWALCARVQLIRPDGARCEHNMGSGCYACVKETHMGLVEPLARLDGRVSDLVQGFAREVAASETMPAGLRRRAVDYVELRERERVVPEAYAAADLLVSPSRFLRERLLASGHFEAQRFLFSDNGMRSDHLRALEKLPDPEGRLRFGFVGSLVWYKGGELLVRAMARLSRTRALLHVHGDFRPESDPHHAELERLAEKAGNVRFLGRFDNARLSEVHAGIDVLVVPSIWFENSPITIHEAFLTRTPVLAGDIGGMAEYVRDGVDGLHFRAGDDADLAAKMRRLLDEPGLLERLGAHPPPVKTIAEDAAETEFRYRGLACRLREARELSGELLELAGAATVARRGPCEEQGGGMLLLRPGGARAEYDLGTLAALSGEELEVWVELRALAGEPELELGGRILVDGRLLARIEPFRGGGVDLERRVAARLRLPRDARRLALEGALALGGREAHLRVARLGVRRPAGARSAAPDAAPAPRPQGALR